MDTAHFTRRFRDDQEIGRHVTDTHLLVFYDDGTDVGVWRQDRRTTRGTGDLLSPADGAMARYWYVGGGRDRAAGDGDTWLAKTWPVPTRSLPGR